MKFTTWFVLLGTMCALTLSAPSAEAALNKKAGGSGTSANLSTNPSIRQQQLIVDPELLLDGQLSVQYDPSLVHLLQPDGYLINYPGFTVEGLSGYEITYLGVLVDAQIGVANGGSITQGNPSIPEHGLLQFGFRLGEGGVTEYLPDGHVNVAAINFEVNDEIVDPHDADKAIYRVFASPDPFAGKPGSIITVGAPTKTTDYFHGKDGSDEEYYVYPPDIFESSNVPEPTAIGLLGMGALALLKRRARKIA